MRKDEEYASKRILYKPEEKCVNLTVLLKKLDKVNVEVLHLILGKLNKNKKNIEYNF